MKKYITSALIALSLLNPVHAGITILKWDFGQRYWKYVGSYHCLHLGEIKFYSNSEITYWRVSHWNEHNSHYLNTTKLWLPNPDGEYFPAYQIESKSKGNIRFETGLQLRNFLANLTGA